MTALEQAIAAAVDAHKGQKDRYGRAYILHPLTLMMAMDDDASRIVAVLHDVVEDTPLTLSDLSGMGFAAEWVDAVDALTKRPGERYEDYIERLHRDPLAVKVKLADLEDNMRITRMNVIGDEDAARLARYLRAWHRLRSLPPQGPQP